MNIISERRTYTDGRFVTRFELVTDDKPTLVDIRDSQMRLGYHPAGYGGPYRTITNMVNDNYVTLWECSGNRD